MRGVRVTCGNRALGERNGSAARSNFILRAATSLRASGAALRRNGFLSAATSCAQRLRRSPLRGVDALPMVLMSESKSASFTRHCCGEEDIRILSRVRRMPSCSEGASSLVSSSDERG